MRHRGAARRQAAEHAGPRLNARGAAARQGKPVILLDANQSQSRLVAKRLSAMGFRTVYVVDGGFEGWVRAGLSVSAPPQEGGFRLQLNK